MCWRGPKDRYVTYVIYTAEFINPKYADATKTKFKSSARLECMMQDYPKLLESCEKVGFTMVNR
jgi:UDP-sugar pyrophosphorylase